MTHEVDDDAPVGGGPEKRGKGLLDVYLSLGIDETYLRIGDVGRRNPKPELITRTLDALALLKSREAKP